MKLYKTSKGIVLEHSGKSFGIDQNWDELVNRDDLYTYLDELSSNCHEVDPVEEKDILAPIGNQEVWAAGVTYLRSRDARMEESKDSGGANMYDKVYDAERPELFFKSMPHRVSGHNGYVNIRKDSSWNVPEPELTLFMSTSGKIQAYTIGNDMSSRSIEGENPLYLPQAKIYERSAALGPCLYIPEGPISPDIVIRMIIKRNGEIAYEDSVAINRIKRSLPELAGYLYRECDFQYGSYLMTGTCLVPPNEFTLDADDEVHITIDHIGTLVNKIAFKK